MYKIFTLNKKSLYRFVWNSMEQHSMEQHGMEQHSMEQQKYGTTQRCV